MYTFLHVYMYSLGCFWLQVTDQVTHEHPWKSRGRVGSRGLVRWPLLQFLSRVLCAPSLPSGFVLESPPSLGKQLWESLVSTPSCLRHPGDEKGPHPNIPAKSLKFTLTGSLTSRVLP